MKELEEQSVGDKVPETERPDIIGPTETITEQGGYRDGVRPCFKQVLNFPPLSKASLGTYCPEMIKRMLVEEFLSIADNELAIMESYVEAYEEHERCKKELEGTETERTDFEDDFIPENY